MSVLLNQKVFRRVEKNVELRRINSCKIRIPYQVVLLSTGDMGFSAEKTYDIEAWIPQKKDIEKYQVVPGFQARRMGAKYKTQNGSEFVGTLNGSGLAVGRLMIALLENNQNDGSINIPNVLKKYMNNLRKFNYNLLVSLKL